jgi:hypothetical protein
MNGYDVLTNSARLIGIKHQDETIKIMGLSFVNAILNEMGFAGLSSLSEAVGVSGEGAEQTLIFGTAMLMANAFGDADGRRAMAELYTRRIAKNGSGIALIRDKLPKGEW